MKRIDEEVLEKLIIEAARDFLAETHREKIKLVTRTLSVPKMESPAFLSFGFTPKDIDAKWVLDITCELNNDDKGTISRLYVFFDSQKYRFVKDFHVGHWWDNNPTEIIEWEIDASEILVGDGEEWTKKRKKEKQEYTIDGKVEKIIVVPKVENK